MISSASSSAAAAAAAAHAAARAASGAAGAGAAGAGAAGEAPSSLEAVGSAGGVDTRSSSAMLSGCAGTSSGESLYRRVGCGGGAPSMCRHAWPYVICSLAKVRSCSAVKVAPPPSTCAGRASATPAKKTRCGLMPRDRCASESCRLESSSLPPAAANATASEDSGSSISRLGRTELAHEGMIVPSLAHCELPQRRQQRAWNSSSLDPTSELLLCCLTMNLYNATAPHRASPLEDGPLAPEVCVACKPAHVGARRVGAAPGVRAYDGRLSHEEPLLALRDLHRVLHAPVQLVEVKR
eukprot:scaffold120831_cov68-Phaeocystis_antarctica.AAC.5